MIDKPVRFLLPSWTAILVAMSMIAFGFSATAQVYQPSGSESAPSYSFVGSTNDGIYSPTSNQLNFVTGGVTRIGIGSTGNVGIGTTSPARLLEVSGPMRIDPAALPSSPDAGDLAIDSGAANSLKYHNGTTWVTISSAAYPAGVLQKFNIDRAQQPLDQAPTLSGTTRTQVYRLDHRPDTQEATIRHWSLDAI